MPDWRRYRLVEHNIRMVFAGEVFSEEWRTELVRRAGSGFALSRYRLALRHGRRWRARQ